MIYSSNQDFIDFLIKKDPSLSLVSNDKARLLVTGQYQKDDYQPSHQYILVPFTGLNGLDLDFIKSKGIHVFNTQAHSKYVAERALSLILTLLGNIIPFDQGLRHGNWAHRNDPNRVPWVSLFDKNIGFFGYGAINQYLHQLLTPFNIQAYIIDRGKDFKGVHKVKDLISLVEVSDVVVIAAPLTDHTKGIFDGNIVSQMKDKILINVGRGPVVNEGALYQALRNETLKGYGSDVWFHYPQGNGSQSPSSYPLESLPNVVFTPHNGGFTETAMKDRFEDIFLQITHILKGDLSGALKI